MKMKRIREKILRIFVMITFMAILSGACAGIIPAQENPLEDTSWILKTYKDTLPIEGARPTLRFEADQVSGTTGCNHYGGSYQVKEDAITFGDLFRTEIGCMEPEGVMEQERIYLNLLQSADRYELSGSPDILKIFAGTQQILTFEVKKDNPVVSTPTVVVVEPTQAPVFDPPVGFKEYKDSVAGVSIFVLESWNVTGVIEGQYAIFQSYPEDKYVGGEGREPGDTKCDLNIQPVGTTAGELIQRWESNELTTIVSDEEIILKSGLVGQRFIIESMGRSMTLLTEINNRAVVLTCFGDFTQVDEIASTISASK